MNYPTILFRAGLVSLLFAASIEADTLVQYTFASSLTAATTSGANVTTASMTKGAGVTFTRSTGTGAGSPAGSIFVEGSQVDEAISATSTDWVGFTITAASGYELNLTSLSFDYAFTYQGGAVPTSATFDVRSSVLGYGTSIDSFTATAVNIGTNPTWLPASVVLTGGDYQNLNSITFRIFLNDGSNASGTSYLRLDTLTLSGVAATAVPEPASYAMFGGLAGLLVSVLGRRRSKQ